MAHNRLAFWLPSPSNAEMQPTKITRLYPKCPKFAYIDLLDNENNTIFITEDYIEIKSPCIDPDIYMAL